MTDLARELQRFGGGRNRRSAVQTSDFYHLGGGLNLEDPNLQTPPGEVVGCNNYEPGLRGGYRRVDGYERLDGRTRPHKAQYFTIAIQTDTFDSNNEPSVHDQVTGATSGATAYYLGLDPDEDRIGLVEFSGTFQADEALNNASGTKFAETDASDVSKTESGATTDDQSREWKYSAQDYYRDLIQKVPGAGPVRGVWVHEDDIFAFRDDADPATESRMYKATSSGWSQIAMGTKVRFHRGEVEIEEGETLTGKDSGASCTVKRVAIFRGQWGADDAMGFIVTDSVTGTFTAGEELQVNSKRVADLYPDVHEEIQLFFETRADYHKLDILDSSDGQFIESEEPDLYDVVTFHDSSTDAEVARGYYLGANKMPENLPSQIAVVEHDGGTHGVQDKVKNEDGVVFATLSGDGSIEKNGGDPRNIHDVWTITAQDFYTDEDEDFDATEKISAGDTVTDGTASATVDRVVLTSGEWKEKTARGYLIVSSVTSGPFSDDTPLSVGSTEMAYSAESDAQISQLRFYKGSTRPKEDDTVTGGTSGATCTVKDVVLLRGSFSEGDAEGYIAFSTSSGAFSQNEDLEISSSKVAQAVPTDVSILSVKDQGLKPGGRYEFRNWNFGGHQDDRRMYGVNGQQEAFEYDPTDDVFVLIETGMSDDRPNHIAVWSNHLFLSFRGGSAQHSGYLRPYSFHPVTGADERTAGENIVGMQEEKQALFIFTRNKAFVLYGDVRENFQMRPFSKEVGAIEWSIQRIGTTFYADDRGMTNLEAVDKYGNFAHASISQKIETLMREHIASNRIRCAGISRRKNLYRLFFSDGSGLVLGIGRKGVTGFMNFDFGGTVTAFSACSGEYEEGSQFEERSLIGADDGFVYELDKGDNFDGNAIDAFMRTSPHYSKSPSRYKRYRKCQIDLESAGKTTIEVAPEYNFGTSFGGKPRLLEASGGGGLWNIDNWNEFKWSAPAKSYLSFKLEGSGYNITFLFHTDEKDEPSHTIYGIMLQWSMRRINRGVSG